MLCIGGIYAWSIIAFELVSSYSLSALQSQVIFGFLIAIFPLTMLIAGKFDNQTKLKHLDYLSGFLFWLGCFLASKSQGNFLMVFLGLGLITWGATGLGYWLSLKSPLNWFPEKKGLVTGIAAAGSGFGGNFVLSARETAQVFGLDNLDSLYPNIFLGYAIIVGLMAGGFIFDIFGSITIAILLASIVGLANAFLFFNRSFYRVWI